VGRGKGMNEPRKGARVLVIEGVEKGTEGILESVFRTYDRNSGTTGKRCTIRTVIPNQIEPSETVERVIRTRLAWVREISE
jgi:hypothetical protein